MVKKFNTRNLKQIHIYNLKYSRLLVELNFIYNIIYIYEYNSIFKTLSFYFILVSMILLYIIKNNKIIFHIEIVKIKCDSLFLLRCII